MRIPVKIGLIICCASVGLLGTPAAVAGTNKSKSGATATAKAGAQKMATNHFCHANHVIGSEVKNPQGQDLGKVHDVVFNPKNGEVFAAIGIGNGHYALVPWQELKVTTSGANNFWWWERSREQVTINMTKQGLQAAPSIMGRESNRLNDPSFVQSIYKYFHAQAPASAMGASSGKTLGGSSTGSNYSGASRTGHATKSKW